MNKQAIFILGLIVLFFGAAYVTTKVGVENENNVIADNIVLNEEKTNITIEENVISTSAEEVKITPNTLLILKKKYGECNHTIIDSAEIPEEMVNLTEEELKDNYSGWEVEKFTKEEVILSKKLNSFCGEHYLLIEEEGKVLIYKLDERGNKELKETTEIAFEYLPETDKIILENGIYVYGIEELNKIKEDFES